ncbi:MAG: isoleucine--tRNA ligase [Puniceicoccales bacterium]|jgi:isoleucyl-tRNA synthetase|nr:isoleucine--tRNA ligase [Puniceicoccales bacterium]
MASVDWKDTLNLPRTDFPIRASATEREPARMAHWQKSRLYHRIQAARADGPVFFLHDGPPFTNGDVHIGTALNKVLKDILIRYKTMRGFRAPYVPGWDCHGLPIEHKVLRNNNKQSSSPLELRRSCAEFSKNFSQKQRQQFERLGLLADWDREYRTMDPAYEAEILEFFADCIDLGLAYWSKRPVYWSIPCRTALAEAEIEYKDVAGPSIWVAFPLPRATVGGLDLAEPAHLVIWTTTPWSLPSNQAIAVHPDLSYAALRCGEKTFIVASVLAEKFLADCHFADAIQLANFPGTSLAGLEARHPFLNRSSPIFAATFVAADAGTGCVHCAPAHGMEDYLLGRENGLAIYCPIDDAGCYVADGQIPPELVGVPILDGNGSCPANGAILNLLRSAGNLVNETTIVHSYPHCWRSKTPVIYRAMDQWFINLERKDLREKVLQAAERVRWQPDWGYGRITAAIASRPDWCISRQRAWGIPIPVFFDEAGQPLLDGNVARGIAAKVRRLGADCWFSQSAEELLADIPVPAGWREKNLRKGTDTLDVWLDSGCSFRAVPKGCPDLTFPADLYVEGSDQHRGWFQSSLWCSVISNGAPPYRNVLTHGFVVGEDRKKISKSDGKPQSADDYVNRHGADVVRLWIASENFRDDIPISDAILGHVAAAYGTIRNALRYQLGNLYDFRRASNAVPFEKMLPLDRWAMGKLGQLIDAVTAAYEAIEFHRVHRIILQFCTVTLSATYHDMLKDRLYTCGADWLERRSAQTALDQIFLALVAMLLPILPFTADEAHAHWQTNAQFAPQPAHLLDWPSGAAFSSCGQTMADIDRLLEVRAEVNRRLEDARRGKMIGKSLDGRVLWTIGRSDPILALARAYQEHLPEIFIVSQVAVEECDGVGWTVAVSKAFGERCSRSWRWCEELYPVGNLGRVSARCRRVLQEQFPDLGQHF